MNAAMSFGSTKARSVPTNTISSSKLLPHLSAGPDRTYVFQSIGDGRAAAFLPARSPLNDLLGIAMIIADAKFLDSKGAAKFVTPTTTNLMRRLSFLRKPTSTAAPVTPPPASPPPAARVASPPPAAQAPRAPAPPQRPAAPPAGAARPGAPAAARPGTPAAAPSRRARRAASGRSAGEGARRTSSPRRSRQSPGGSSQGRAARRQAGCSACTSRRARPRNLPRSSSARAARIRIPSHSKFPTSIRGRCSRVPSARLNPKRSAPTCAWCRPVACRSSS